MTAKAFFISPFGHENSSERKRSDFILDEILEPAFRDLNIVVDRGEAITNETDIDDKITKLIVHSTFVIVDNADYNPNVFFEAGIAWTIEKPFIFLNSKINDERAKPFNVYHIEHISIPDNWAEYKFDLKKFEEDKKKAISKLRKNGKAIINGDYRPPKSGAHDIIKKEFFSSRFGKENELEELKKTYALTKWELDIANAKLKGTTENDRKIKEVELRVKSFKESRGHDLTNLFRIDKILNELSAINPEFVAGICTEILLTNKELAIYLTQGKAYYVLSMEKNNTNQEFKNKAIESFENVLHIDSTHEGAQEYLSDLK